MFLFSLSPFFLLLLSALDSIALRKSQASSPTYGVWVNFVSFVKSFTFQIVYLSNRFSSKFGSFVTLVTIPWDVWFVEMITYFVCLCLQFSCRVARASDYVIYCLQHRLVDIAAVNKSISCDAIISRGQQHVTNMLNCLGIRNNRRNWYRRHRMSIKQYWMLWLSPMHQNTARVQRRWLTVSFWS